MLVRKTFVAVFQTHFIIYSFSDGNLVDYRGDKARKAISYAANSESDFQDQRNGDLNGAPVTSATDSVRMFLTSLVHLLASVVHKDNPSKQEKLFKSELTVHFVFEPLEIFWKSDSLILSSFDYINETYQLIS